jgi:DNA-binding transcriptional MocR family regulator
MPKKPMLKKSMPKKRPERPVAQIQVAGPAQSSIPADAALSFLKDTKEAVTWSIRDLADTLKINRRDAEQAIALLAAQGYVQPANEEWITTPAGESVSGAKPARFTRESIQQAVKSLKERISQVNKDPKAAYRITAAVAFGDFLLSHRARAQAADVGIALEARDKRAGELRSASDARGERMFLRQLRGRTALVHIRPYAEWMSKRSGVNLL